MIKLVLGDCLEKLKELGDNSVDSIVTDPPCAISFMGKHWDSDKGGKVGYLAIKKKICSNSQNKQNKTKRR